MVSGELIDQEGMPNKTLSIKEKRALVIPAIFQSHLYVNAWFFCVVERFPRVDMKRGEIAPLLLPTV